MRLFGEAGQRQGREHDTFSSSSDLLLIVFFSIKKEAKSVGGVHAGAFVDDVIRL